jgi:hypothetical protein
MEIQQIYLFGAIVIILFVLNSLRSSTSPLADCFGLLLGKLRKVLIPDVYQNFELVEKTVISHNTASYLARKMLW